MAGQNHNLIHYFFTVIYKLAEGLISSLIWFFVGIAGYLIYQTKRTPFDLVFGIPLMLVGGGLVINKLWGGILSIFSPTYNEGVCVFCEKARFKNHKSVKKILGLKE